MPAEALSPETEIATPGAVLVVDGSGALRDRSPRAKLDPELGALTMGATVPGTILDTAHGHRWVDEGSSLEALWISRGEAPLSGGLSERDVGTLLLRMRSLVGTLVASLDAEDMFTSGPISSQLGTTRRREVDRLVESIAALGHAFAPTGARGSVDLELLLRRVVDALRGEASKRDVTLHLTGADAARRNRTGDEGLLEAGLNALVTNAVEATPNGGSVHVRVESSEAAVTIVVDDDGPGLLTPRRGDLGRPFVSTKRGGFGLGMCIARRAAFVHGGELRVATRSANGGVGAQMWIPVAAR